MPNVNHPAKRKQLCLEETATPEINKKTTNIFRERPGETPLAKITNINDNENMNVKIVNISKRNISNSEKKILEKGLKFTPTPQHSNINEISDDLAEVTRKFRLAEFFHSKDERDDSLVRNKSHFIPPKKQTSISRLLYYKRRKHTIRQQFYPLETI